MLNNMKIGLRLGLGFTATLLLLLTISVVGTLRLSHLTDNLNLVINDRNPKIAQANDIIDALNVIARSMRNTLLIKSTEEANRELARIVEQRKIIGERIEKLDATVSTPKGKEALKAMKDARAAYIPQQDRFTELVKSGNRDEALELMLGTIRKKQTEYFKAINDLIGMLNEITG